MNTVSKNILWLLGVLCLMLVSSCSTNQDQHTKLYFLDSENIPFRHEISSPVNVVFAIENSEGKDANYDYFIVLESYKNKQLTDSKIKTGSLFLKDGEMSVVLQDFNITRYDTNMQRARVILNDQEIHYWLEVFDKNTFNKTFYCGIEVTDYKFDNDDWDRNDPIITKGMAYCEEPPRRVSLP